MSKKYPIRRESLISPWGVGSIVPFPHDESLMIAGLDYWFAEGQSYKDFIIVDERLSKRLGGKLFVSPPDYREIKQDAAHAGMEIPAVRFPLWHYCPVCGNMEQIGTHGDRKHCSGEIRKIGVTKTYCSENKSKSKNLPYLVPERFIAVCEKGHIEDFPIMEWVHKKSNKSIVSTCKLYRSTGGQSASLAGIRYTCICGATATMTGAFGRDALKNVIGYTCSGNRPWLGENQNEPCEESLLVLQRGASNVWFADIISSVYIPWLPVDTNEHTKLCIANGTKKFASSKTNGEFDVFGIKQYISFLHENIYNDIDENIALEQILLNLKSSERVISEAQADDLYRKEEYDVLIRNAGAPDKELYVKRQSSSQYSGLPYLHGISLVNKLRETRAFVSFRRISPSIDSVPAKISVDEIPWLPAVKNSGEGIMFEFDNMHIQKWMSNPKVIERIGIIETNIKNAKGQLDGSINPVYVLLHTFAHCLINALSSSSGYSNASIRERIYCPKFLSADKIDMTGVLIYTASGDSEGSLGGLVRQGMPGRIENVIRRAITEARWCAADPVCIQSSGQGQNGCNLSACHNCALLPETSCENKNMLLDRGLLIGTLTDRSIGFFNEYYED